MRLSLLLLFLSIILYPVIVTAGRLSVQSRSTVELKHEPPQERFIVIPEEDVAPPIYKEANHKVKTEPKKVYSNTEVACLAQNIYFEARGESERGQIAVAKVTLNRVNDPSYPKTICGVVKQAKVDANGHPYKYKCQFSWYCDGVPKRMRDREAIRASIRIAMQVLYNDTPDPTNGATHYHASYVKPYWASSLYKTARIGAHIFYKV